MFIKNLILDHPIKNHARFMIKYLYYYLYSFKYKNNITKLYSYKYRNNYTSICICIHVNIPGLLYKYH